jgi:hypothetical protein
MEIMDSNSLLDFISRLYARAILFLQGEGQLDIMLFGLLLCVGVLGLLLLVVIMRIVSAPAASSTIVVSPPAGASPSIPWAAIIVLMALLSVGFVALYMFSGS